MNRHKHTKNERERMSREDSGELWLCIGSASPWEGDRELLVGETSGPTEFIHSHDCGDSSLTDKCREDPNQHTLLFLPRC